MEKNRINEKGQSMVEYGLVIGLMTIIALSVMVLLGPQIKSTFNKAVTSDDVTNSQNILQNTING